MSTLHGTNRFRVPSICLTVNLSRFNPACVLVTGGAGFIGSNYLLHMVARHPDTRFMNLDALTYAGNLMNLSSIDTHPNYAFVHGDITDVELLQGLFDSYPIDAVVHFAAESHVDRSIADARSFIRTNINGTHSLLDAARHAWSKAPSRPVRFHHVSTDEVFGTLGDSGHFTEETAYAPRSPYAASKASSDHLVRAYHETYGLPVVITNTSNNYGPFQFPEKLIPLVISRAVAGDTVPVYGKGSQIRDWLHVEDHVSALERVLLDGHDGATYLIGGRQEARNIDLVKQLLNLVDEALGRGPGTSHDLIEFVSDRPGHDYRYALDCSFVEKELGWTPSRTLEEGLRETVAWYLANQEWLDAVRDERYRDYLTLNYHSR